LFFVPRLTGKSQWCDSPKGRERTGG
jgi:hypothetical protein